MTEKRRREGPALWQQIRLWVHSLLAMPAVWLRDALEATGTPLGQRLARRCTPAAARRVLGSVATLLVCLAVFHVALPLLKTEKLQAKEIETPKLVRTVTFSNLAVLRSLEINWVRGPIRVEPYDGDSVRLYEYASGPVEDDDQCTAVLSSGRLQVEWRDALLPPVDAGIGEGLYKRLEVYIPRQQAKGMEYFRILSGESAIAVSGVTATISVRAECSAGGVSFTNVRAPLCVLKSETGDIACSNADFDELQLQTLSGNVNFAGSAGEADLRTVDGPVTWNGALRDGRATAYSGLLDMQLRGMPNGLEITSAVGDIQVTLDRAVSCTVTLEAPHGEISVQSPEDAQDAPTDTIVLGRGRGRLRVSTYEGDVTFLTRA